jgi:hypothetical protein
MKFFLVRNKDRIILALALLLAIPGCNIPSATPQEEKPINNEWVSLNNSDEIGRYFLKDGKIYVHVNGMISEELKNADPASFQANRKFSEFGRDKSHVWFISSELSVDLATWEIISQGYSKDEIKIYCGVHQLADADPKTFKVIRDGFAEWGADKESVYHQWFKLEDSDPQTFEFIDDSFSKDNNNVYFYQNRLEGADPKSFKIIKGNVGKDKNAIFAFGKKMPSYIDMSSVRVPGDGYIYDKNGRYHLYQGEWIKTQK